MKIHGIKREWSKPFWVRYKKHYCPTCMNLLATTKVSKIVNSNSEKGQILDFCSNDCYNNQVHMEEYSSWSKRRDSKSRRA